MARVALFVDGANMFYAQRDNGWHIDWNRVYQYFTDNREVAGAYYFTATPPAHKPEQVVKYRKFRGALIHMGYEVVDKEVRVMRDDKTGMVKMKGNLDVDLTFRMLSTVGAYDQSVLFGGDIDFVPILSHLKNLGKKVTCVGRSKSTSIEIKNIAEFIDLETIRQRIEKPRRV